MRSHTALYTSLFASALASSVQPPFPPPPPLKPWLYFGANGTGPVDSMPFLSLASRGGLGGYGWQNFGASTNFSHGGEAHLLGAAAALAAYAPALPVFVYRHFQMAWRLFDVQRPIIDDPKYRTLLLHDNDNAPAAKKCLQGVPGNGTSPLLVFEAPSSAGQWWVDRVVGEVAAEPSITAVFFDETDWSYCGYNFTRATGCSNLSAAFLARDYAAKLPALRATADALAAAGKWPIFSSKNLREEAWQGLPAKAIRPCVVPGNAYAAALEGATWGRFYEFWMGQGATYDAATIANVLLEGAAGVGLIARAPADAAAQCPGDTSSCDAPAMTELSYALAAFLIARTSPYSYFGVSSGWYSQCWCWHAEYDAAAACGAPTAPPIRTSPFSWTRAYEHCTVSVNTTAQKGAFLAEWA